MNTTDNSTPLQSAPAAPNSEILQKPKCESESKLEVTAFGTTKFQVGSANLEWDLAQGILNLEKFPAVIMWLDTTLAGLMAGVQAMVGAERFGLALQSEGRRSVKDDWQFISQFSDFQEGLAALNKAGALAGWGNLQLQKLSLEQKECRFRMSNSWEGRYQKTLGVCWGSSVLAGKLAGYCSKLFETNCWAEQTSFTAKGDEFDEFVVRQCDRTIEEEIDKLLFTDEATRADLAVACEKLKREVERSKQVEAALRESESQYHQLMERLEDLVAERTAELARANERLEQEISDRKQAESALQRSTQRLREQTQREKLLNCLSSEIRNSLDLNIILETAVREIRDLLEIDRCHFAWYFPQAEEPYWDIIKEARTPDFPNLIGRYLASEVGPLAEKLLKLETLQVDDVEKVSDLVFAEFVRSLGYFSVLVLPIQTRSGAIGAIACSHSRATRPWSDSEVELLQAVTDQLAIAIDQAELHARSREAALVARSQAAQLQATLAQLQRTQAQLVQTEKMSGLGQLVAGVAHEINNPVNFIYGNLVHANEYTAEILGLLELYQKQYPKPTPDIQEEIEAIDLDYLLSDLPKLLSSMKVGAERIREIVLSLRNFSRLDEAEMKAVDIHEGIESTLLILQSRLKVRPDRPAIIVSKEYGALPLVECYAGQLNQVFMNLLANAIDALDECNRKRASYSTEISTVPETSRGNGYGGSSLTLGEIKAYPSTIRIRTEVLDSNRVAIAIADNGMGMSSEVKQRIFDPFFTTKAVGIGTGLGLAISYQIVVEKHEGQLRCTSHLGQGSEFVIEIPIRQKLL